MRTVDRQAVSPGDTIEAGFTDDSDGLQLLAYDDDSGAIAITSSPDLTQVDYVDAGVLEFVYSGTFGALPDRIRFSRVYLDNQPLSAYPDSQVNRYRMQVGGYDFKPGLLGRQNVRGSFFGVAIRPTTSS